MAATSDDEHRCERSDALEAEVRRLRARIVQLEAENAALLRAAVNRDHERPPHYE